LNRPLRVVEREPGIFAVDGTPADSVYVALNSERVLPRRPDVVVSGMNHGLNLGLDVFYSGTVAAAREGALQGLLAVAISACRSCEPAEAAVAGSRLSRSLWRSGLVGGRLFNVNEPPGQSWTVRPTRLGQRSYPGGLVRRQDPRGQDYYWIGGSDAEVTHGDVPGSDTEAYDAGVIGVTPLLLDLWASPLEGDAALLVERWDELG
jgi:5'-nucleotidase